MFQSQIRLCIFLLVNYNNLRLHVLILAGSVVAEVKMALLWSNLVDSLREHKACLLIIILRFVVMIMFCLTRSWFSVLLIGINLLSQIVHHISHFLVFLLLLLLDDELIDLIQLSYYCLLKDIIALGQLFILFDQFGVLTFKLFVLCDQSFMLIHQFQIDLVDCFSFFTEHFQFFLSFFQVKLQDVNLLKIWVYIVCLEVIDFTRVFIKNSLELLVLFRQFKPKVCYLFF